MIPPIAPAEPARPCTRATTSCGNASAQIVWRLHAQTPTPNVHRLNENSTTQIADPEAENVPVIAKRPAIDSMSFRLNTGARPDCTSLLEKYPPRIAPASF